MPIPKQKVCPLVLRQKNGIIEMLVFQHPLAGIQLVKGSIEQGETPENAALRELYEESGIKDASIELKFGEQLFSEFEQFWHIYKIKVETELPETWDFYTQDGG